MSEIASSRPRAGEKADPGGVRPGTLYVVATPIGNMGDLSPRAREVLSSVALIAAEDTRHAGQLLTRVGVTARLLSLHEHNEAGRVDEILTRLRDGDSVALVTDAGTPLISDPGYRLLAALRAADVPVSPVPGACAAIAALSVAGLPTDRFFFEGFLPARSAARVARLRELVGRGETLVFYESANRLSDTLADAIGVFGEGRAAAVGRELTKLHETVYRGSLAEVRAALLADPGGEKGECTWLVAGTGAEVAPDDAELARVVGILAAELPASQAASLAAKITGAPRRAAYRLAIGKEAG
ncbi:MAG: 16S rRNA (cytidine(1402)-2'-O)-methyltransferase [Gammaproteobacteria bacterium]|nr:16S rRNA (cytidine(1402)-2'-O)-methyltransferase [Gammaproteobacteria bacterium]